MVTNTAKRYSKVKTGNSPVDGGIQKTSMLWQEDSRGMLGHSFVEGLEREVSWKLKGIA